MPHKTNRRREMILKRNMYAYDEGAGIRHHKNIKVPDSGTQEENMEKIKQESLEMFMLKRKILKELEQMDENEDFIMQIGLAGKEKNE